ncbi:GNAT family N-acetyltransferase [Weissella paramesenteroides]|jgi:GNAT superfamily N-acetyltransferase|uniref:Acetyltransferase, GNAT family n=1 Tax=Weissella paramesenteroides ATCC 33313 TaxID=585506 RepID=C5R9V9_WEIPA|nr:GNAT family N-acetyltransferase [Weissella paramesenteroides]ATF42033.1 N-acetyltransferase [Weissella paramesenteroides]EER75209.1 acetyltransferase, GNAT family [Weissella paramesenteroides ATCC 33313]KAA8439931.1 GNAT family N-acetyltransferase [Weissella paramesenteroides]KAA8441312.1 GNAT family N-acetyltransferase [Weissella paramesenteroides]KAA8444054.1 GNAT family N-acetyltransferase [Weissella paramesenteroides]
MSLTYTRQAKPSDVDAIYRIIQQAVAYLGSQNSPQWQGSAEPNRKEFEDDINKGIVYVLIYNHQVAGVGKLVPGPEQAYEDIDGSWLGNESQYMSLHRIAIDADVRGQGLAHQLIHDLVMLSLDHGYRDIRIDTHEINKGMQKTVKKADFDYRGHVQMPVPNGDRLAFQLLLTD